MSAEEKLLECQRDLYRLEERLIHVSHRLGRLEAVEGKLKDDFRSFRWGMISLLAVYAASKWMGWI